MTSREELYRLVWSKPMTKVAAEFGVSGSYLARICTVLNVPRPERGYWAKLAVGRARPPEPLPEARPGDQQYWSNDGEQPAPPPQPRSGSVRPRRRIRLPADRIHNLLIGAKAHFENSRSEGDDGYLKPFKRLLVDVTTSKTNLDKALDFANALFSEFESLGHRVVMAPSDAHLRRATIDEREVRTKQRNGYYCSNLWSPHRPTVVYLGSVAIGLAIVEMSEDVLLRYVSGKYIREADYNPPKTSRYNTDYTWTTTRELPSGRFRFVAYSPYWRVNWSKDWDETARFSLQAAVKTIAKFVESESANMIEKLEEAERRAEIERREFAAAEEKRRREEDRRCVERSVRESQEHLRQIIEQWSNVLNVERFLVSVERFLVSVEQRVGDLPETKRALVHERLALAREFLGAQDPLAFFLAWKTPRERYRSPYSSG